ncbi:MAG: pyrroline-5-carboxylate reductase [Firmicutes bacterium]|nr:pyrroline-5-carboxylate reductase [Bacillota bacterium]MBR0113764.1 pyrroline-5-carboxylate reductase [Bacillota bacterium]MBR0441336.1 pyrroline-5-carboxylate reductase [Bacillota bacterium]
MKTIGFIGAGNMGGSLLRAACKKHDPAQIMVADKFEEKVRPFAEGLGCVFTNNEEIAKKADYIFLGVKPQMMEDMLKGIAPFLAERKGGFVLVSMAAGMMTSKITAMAGCPDYPIIRIMPNLPASVGEGAILYTRSGNVTDEQLAYFLDFMEKAGKFYPIAEHLIDAGSSVSGCGPAFAAMFVEALADGGVACGLTRHLAYELAEQMMYGTAKLLMEGTAPATLKDNVCSPGGTTIQGVRALEYNGFRSALFEAVVAATEKNKDFA